tara:strand:+ start:451 stop:687 length:237 start_codon:yes stop_codon:yes gene_type:complete
MTKAQIKKIKQLTPLIKAIKDRCYDCSGKNYYEVKMCVCPDCPLYPYRMGLNSQEAKITRENSEKSAENVSEEESENE